MILVLGVSSEGEKSQVVVEDIEEGREAEASEAGPSRSSGVVRGSGTARRSVRQLVVRSRAKPPPQRITWEESNSSSLRGVYFYQILLLNLYIKYFSFGCFAPK